MDAGINPNTGDLSGERISSLANAVYIRIKTPLGSYWADPSLGSRLHELEREKDLARVAVLARQYAEQALQPLLDANRADGITVSTQRRNAGLQLRIEVDDATGTPQVFRYLVRVL